MRVDAWYKFTAYNEQTIHGYGSAMQARDYANMLNWSRVDRHYTPHELSEAEARELDLENRSDTFNLYEELVGE